MAANVNLLECIVCIDLMVGPIYQCVRGHSLCQNCLTQLPSPKKCPMCRDDMTDVRNIIVESLVEIELRRRLKGLNTSEVQVTPGTTKVPCRFQSEGCKYRLHQKDFDGHIEECLFRDMICPFGTFNSNCLWIGKFSTLKNHFLSQHPDGILSVESEHATPDLQNCTGLVRLILLDKLHFVLCWQWDPIQNIHLIAVQSIGTKIYAQNWNYDIKFYKVESPRRSFTFTDVCQSDSVQTLHVFQNKQCIVIPSSIFNEFGTGLRFKVRLYKNELPTSKNFKGPKPSSMASSSPLPTP